MTKKIKRHSLLVIINHWLIAISCFLLFFSGFGQMPLYRRYMLTEVPGFGWADQFFITVKMHYIATVVLIVAIFFHIVYHVMRREMAAFPKRGDLKESVVIIKAMFGKGAEPPAGKFLAEQRLAYLYIGVVLLMLIGSGLIKTAQNYSQFELPYTLTYIATAIHNLSTMLLLLGVIAHLLAFVLKPNRPLIESMFTGKVSADYAKERHGKWVQKSS